MTLFLVGIAISILLGLTGLFKLLDVGAPAESATLYLGCSVFTALVSIVSYIIYFH